MDELVVVEEAPAPAPKLPPRQRFKKSKGVYVYARFRRHPKGQLWKGHEAKGPCKRDWVCEQRPGGGEPKRYFIFPLEREAEAKKAELLSTLKVDTAVNEEKATHTVAVAWQVYQRESTNRAGTLETYTSSMSQHVLPAFKDELVVNLTQKRIKEWVFGLLRPGSGEGLAPNTAKNALCALRNVIDPYFPQGGNPALQPKKKGWIPKAEIEPRSLSAAQLQEFLAAAAGHPLEPLIRFLSYTAVRLGEALALRWENVDLSDPAKPFARILKSVRKKTESAPKTSFGRRTVDVPPDWSRDVLAKLPSREAGGLVFPSEKGTYLNPRYVDEQFRKIGKLCALTVTPHMLRHTWAFLNLNAGVDIYFVSRKLGHASVAFTAKVYAGAHPDGRPDVARAFEALANGGGK